MFSALVHREPAPAQGTKHHPPSNSRLAGSTPYSSCYSCPGDNGDSDDTDIALAPPRQTSLVPVPRHPSPSASTLIRGASATQPLRDAGHERESPERTSGLRVELCAAYSELQQLHPRPGAASKCHPSYAHDKTWHHCHQLLRGLRGR